MAGHDNQNSKKCNTSLIAKTFALNVSYMCNDRYFDSHGSSSHLAEALLFEMENNNRITFIVNF